MHKRFWLERQEKTDNYEDLNVGGIIVTCRGVRVMENNGSSSDDWICCSFLVQLHLVTINTALSLIYTLSSSPLHTQ
jgi:hypothetical protein